jgi:hypothetical protein
VSARAPVLRHDALTGERIPRPVPVNSRLPVRHLRPSPAIADGMRNADVAASPVVVVQVELRPCQDRPATPGTRRTAGSDQGRVAFPQGLVPVPVAASVTALNAPPLPFLEGRPVLRAIRAVRRPSRPTAPTGAVHRSPRPEREKALRRGSAALVVFEATGAPRGGVIPRAITLRLHVEHRTGGSGRIRA